MSLFDYDYDDLAGQIQGGLERLAVNFLRGHGARVRRDLVDFHGYEQVDLELTHDGHTLKVHQVGRPRGPGIAMPEVAGHLEEAFESTFDGWPAADVPRETIASWLAALPAGEAPPEKLRAPEDPSNPFAVERPRSAPWAEQKPASNPFLTEPSRQAGSNPFLNTDREEKRKEMLRRLKGDEEE
jgi:hypothetical protein